jgi:Fur family zinc uptake transcriptional regulator
MTHGHNASPAEVEGQEAPPHDHELCVADALSYAERLCRRIDARFTPLRRRVLELVWAGHKPVGAYQLLESLRSEGLGSAPPTVYRALEFLLEYRLIHRIESLNAYVGCSHLGDVHRGIFLICRRCGNSEELGDGRLGDDLLDMAKARGFDVTAVTLEIAGICAPCKEAA